METDFLDFNGDKRFLSSSNLSNDEEMMKDHLGLLESLKTEEVDIPWTEPEMSIGREDFQQIMSDWQQHVGFPQPPDPEELGLDASLDLLNTDLFEEIQESPILSKALTSPVHRSLLNTQSAVGSLDIKRPYGYSTPSETLSTSPLKSKISQSIEIEPPTVVRKLMLINGDKEILGKNIVNLHCLDQIETSPDENCKITSTVINGKRFRIIIKPKSQKAKKLSQEKIRQTLFKKLSKCSWIPKVEPKEECTWVPKMEQKEDEITSEMCNGNYDVPLLGNDLYSSWDMSSLDAELNQVENAISDFMAMSETETPKKVPPLKIKIPKSKKLKKKKAEVKIDNEEIDVETVCDNNKTLEASCLTDLLTSFEKESKPKVEKREAKETDENKVKREEVLTNENIKNSLPKEMIHRIESLKRKKGGRIPLIQAMPTKKAVKNGTRMQDAGATMNRNKLLKIVSGGDTVQLDHDYCTNFLKNTEEAPKKSKLPDSSSNLTEKNPKKDSGLESGDVSDASEEPHTPESLQNVQAIREINSSLLKQRSKDHASITKAAAEFFRASNATRSKCVSDTVKTKTVSNGNKALTNKTSSPSTADSDNSVIVPNDSDVSDKVCCNNDDDNQVDSPKDESNAENFNQTSQQNVRQKRKLKLEEYLSRRNEKKKAVDNKTISSSNSSNDNNSNDDNNDDRNNLVVNEPMTQTEPTDVVETNTAKEPQPNVKSQSPEETKKTEQKFEKHEETKRQIERSRKNRQYRSRRSSSSSSGERDERRRRSQSKSKSKSRSRSRSKSRSKSRSRSWRNNRRENQGRYRYRRSLSREKRQNVWSRSSSRSTSSSSSSSTGRPGRWRRSRSPVRYRRRSRSRSLSRNRSRSRNRGYSNRQRPYYFNRNYNNRRSRSPPPFRVYTMREKQRQIEERRVIYVGRIEEGMTNSRLRDRFGVFGPIIDISLHFREQGDNYGFVTFAYKSDAYDAVEHGNEDPDLPRYDLCFGGRRGFCKERYADLDGMPTSYSGFNEMPVKRSSEESFDLLLREFQANLKKRKHSSKT